LLSFGWLWIFPLEPCTLCKSSFFAPGTKEDCDKEALNLSFSSSPSHLRLKDDYDSNSGKHHGKTEIIFFKVAQPSVFYNVGGPSIWSHDTHSNLERVYHDGKVHFV